MRNPVSSPTTRDVARLAGVSRATVSFVINGRTEGRVAPETHERVLRAAETLGYRPNRIATALSTGRTYIIGIVSEIEDYLETASTMALYTKNVFMAVTVAAARSGLNTACFLQMPDQQLRPEDVADGRVDGIVVFGMYHNHDWVRRAAAMDLPCVEIGTHLGRYSVQIDNAGGMRLAVEHLLSLGHRRIAHFTGLPDPSVVQSALQRQEGFRQTIAAAGIPEEDAPIVNLPGELAALFSSEVPSSQQPTAIVSYNDKAAVSALDVLHACGRRVPEDVSLIGFDNELRAETMRPALTTVTSPIDELARVAVAVLRRRIEGEALDEEAHVIPTELVLRESTSRAAA